MHLGMEKYVKNPDIIGIFDMDNTTVSKASRDFLNTAQKSGKIVNAAPDLPKSFVLTADEVILCGQNTSTLRGNLQAAFLK